jgi:hypothetical protein
VRKGSTLKAPFGTESDRRHDFGPILGGRTTALDHVYLLTNRSNRPVRLVRALNLKSCCGDVELQPALLAPGERAELRVTLRIGDSIGPVTHRAAVETDLPEAQVVEFWTSAVVYPEARIEQRGEGAPAVSPGATSRREFVAITYGTPDRPAVPLDDPALAGSLPVAWIGPIVEDAREGGLIERSRPFAATRALPNDPGVHVDEVRLVRDGVPVAVLPIRWDVVSVLTATPGALVRGPTDAETQSILLRARDNRAFRVLGGESSLAGVCAAADKDEPAASQAIRVSFSNEPASEGRSGQLHIRTDHPKQPVVTVPLYIAENAVQAREAREGP